MSREPRIDAYIAKAQPFARPILERVRERVHALVPGIEETMKWSMPAYTLGGKIVVQTAAFNRHATVHFWRGQELGFEVKDGAMGQLGKLTKAEDLPKDLDAMIARAAELSRNAPSPRKPKHEPKPAPQIHPELEAALAKSPNAKATFDAFTPSCRREYVEWVGEAKRDETRAKRIATTIEWLSEGKKRNWKYENCSESGQRGTLVSQV